MISPAVLDDLMNRAWPGLTSVDVDGWLVRMAGGVTQRANSVLPVDAPRDVISALSRVESLYVLDSMPVQKPFNIL